MNKQFAESQFCVSTLDGKIEPALDIQETKELSKFFAPGITIGGRYYLESCIGQGGMGQVFLARDQRLDREVAIKVVSRSRINDEQNFYETMLAREAKLGANLNHPGIATVHDFGFHAGRSYTVFEYVDGHNLRTLLQEKGKFTLEQARDVIAGLARALDFAHGQGIVHRDLKPENICRSTTGEYKILDFGIARDFSSDSDRSSFAGTPAYSAPEQVGGQPVDGRTDQYTLACVFFELLTERKIFEGETFQEFLDKHLSDQPPKLSSLVSDISPDVDAALLRALSKDPASRFDSCQEFAEALGCDEEKVFFRKLARVSDRETTNCYVCHASEDSIFARQLATKLREYGYSSWYYQRDAIPGISLFSQTDDAIRHSAICIILISRAGIESMDLAREIQQAHRVGTALVPVLVDLSLQEFEALQPIWRTILGPIAKIEAERNSVDTLSERIHAAAKAIGIKPTHSRFQPIVDKSQLVSGQIWATDAYQIDINELKQVVFENELISTFLRRKNKHFISATKGLGKTLLLTYKRLLLTEEFKTSGSPITLVPQGRPFLDFMGEMRSLSQKYEAPLSELTNSKRLWSAALRISAISYCENIIADDEKFELKPFSERLRRWLLGNSIEPTIVFKELTSLSVSDFNRLIDETEGFLDQKLRQVHSPIYFFIDKVDQAIRNLGSAAWINVQAGLIEAAWDLMNSNSHIKVFASIRDEAYSNYESDIKSNLRGAVTRLRYSETELAEMLDRLSQCYEGADSFKDFVGMNVVTSGKQAFLEDSFQLIRRFSFGRPRDLVSMASEMSAAKSSLNEKKFCSIIRETAATGLTPSIFDETRIFLDSLREKEARLRFLTDIPCNILERHQIKQLTARFNGLPDSAIEHFENLTDLYRPFQELCLAGVLGVIVDDPDGDGQYQHFKQPDDLMGNLEFQLPDSAFYLVHPALDVFIQKNRPKKGYQVFQQIPVGFMLPWRPYYELVCQIEKSLLQVEDPRFVESVHQVLQKYQLAARNKSEEAMESVLTSAEWKWINQNADTTDRQDVLLWLNELVQRDT
jgi:serine/threonine protein kinase